MLRIEGYLDPVLKAGTAGMVAMLNEELGQGAEQPMANGTLVTHRVFGEGVIESYDATSKSYKVRFGQTVRNLLPTSSLKNNTSVFGLFASVLFVENVAQT